LKSVSSNLVSPVLGCDGSKDPLPEIQEGGGRFYALHTRRAELDDAWYVVILCMFPTSIPNFDAGPKLGQVMTTKLPHGSSR